MPEYIIFILVIIGIQFFAFLVVLLIWKSDCKTYKKENLALSLKERLLLLVITFFVPMWVAVFFLVSNDLRILFQTSLST